MSIENDLRKWLKRPENDFITNLEFGIKVWNSMEFVLLTKYEIIFEYFCNNLSKLAADCKDDKFNEKWSKINDFLKLDYPPNSVSYDMKCKLINVMINEIEKLPKLSKKTILQSFLILLNHDSMISCYKNIDIYGEILATSLQHFILYLKTSEVDNENVKISTTSIINNINTYIKQTTDMDQFCRIFSNKIQTPLTELIIILNIKKINYDDEYFKLLQIIYFNEKSIEIYRQQIISNDMDCLLSSKIHPNFVFIKIAEAFLINFKYDLEIITLYIKYLFDNIFIWESGIFANTIELLKSIDFIFYSLKKHNIKLVPEINDTKIIKYIGDKIKTCIDLYFETNMYETIKILCSTIIFNPIIVEQYIFSMFTKYMLAKKDKKLLHMYTELSYLFLNMFQKLSRTEKCVSNLISSVREELNNVKLVKRQKRKINTESDMYNSLEETNLNVIDLKNDNYIDLLQTNDYYYQVYDQIDSDSWQDIAFAWPTQTTGVHFSQIVSNMLSKPSLVIWKSILYPLNDVINKLPIDKIDENSLFIVDFLSALFCEYLAGNRLAEQTDKFWNELNANRELTHKLLKEFGMTILKIEHNSRLMNAYLQICYHFGNLDLLCWYYCPEIVLKNNEIDFNANAKSIHNYMTKDEWILIEQRIVNFGKTICKNNINKLYLQRIRTNLLFNIDKQSIPSTLLLSSLSDYAQIVEILNDNTSSILFINLLTRQEKILVANLIITVDNFDLEKLRCIFDNIKENTEMVNILIISIYKKISKVISNKKSALNSVDYDSIYAYEEDHLNDLLSIIRKKINKTIKIDKSIEEELLNYLNLLKLLPIGFINANIKNLVFILNMLLYCDIKTIDSDTILTNWKTIFDYLFEMDTFPDIFQYFDIHLMLTLFENINLYKKLFEQILTGSLKHLNENIINNLQELLNLLNDENAIEKENILVMSTILLSCFQNVKRFDNHRKEIKTMQLNLQKQLFERIKTVILSNENNNMDKNAFILKTLNCFNILVKILLSHNKIDDINEIFPIYLNYCKNNILDTDAQQLILTIFINKNLLKLSTNDLDDISDIYLNNFKEQIKNLMTNNNNKNGMVISTDLLKTILDNKSDEDFLKFMDHVYEESKEENPTNAVLFITKFMSYLGKCNFSITKRYIFGDYIKVIFFHFQSKLSNNHLLASKINITCDVLTTLTIICSNPMVPITAEHIDDILLFLIEINIKKMPIDVDRKDEFFKLNEKMSELCLSLIKNRLIFVLERLVQFICVLKDMQQSICWYRSERDNDDKLENNEINILAELMYNLEKIYSKLFQNKIQTKKLSPYLLLFTIYLMVENPRPTTLHQKIKTHVQNICYILIKNCDDKSKPFIMRESSEASKKLYEKLNDEFNKYHKFKGKV